jgi:mRNA interferase MazF
LVDAPLVRVTLQPSTTNRLRAVSQVMVDKATTVLRSRLGPVFGQVDDQVMVQVDRSLAVFVGIAK